MESYNIIQTKIKILENKIVIENSKIAKNILVIADQGINSIIQSLDKQLQLTTTSLSGYMTDNAREFLDIKFQALKEQIEMTSLFTSYSNIALLDGCLNKNITIGTHNFNIKLPSFKTNDLYLFNDNRHNSTISYHDAAQEAYRVIEDAKETSFETKQLITDYLGELGSYVGEAKYINENLCMNLTGEDVKGFCE